MKHWNQILVHKKGPTNLITSDSLSLSGRRSVLLQNYAFIPPKSLSFTYYHHKHLVAISVVIEWPTVWGMQEIFKNN